MNLDDLAKALKVKLCGDATKTITGLAPVDTAGENDLAFVVSAKYKSALQATRAGAVIVPAALSELAPGNCLVSTDPYASYAQASWLLKPSKPALPGMHKSAVVDESAQISSTAHIGPGVVIGANTTIGEHVVINAGCCLGSDVHIAAGCFLFANVTLYDNVQLGQHCRIQSGAVLGSEGFGYAWTSGGWSQIQQTGGVRVGERVHVGANTTIDCGAIDPTVIADGVILDNQIQIAHNVQIGENTAIAGCTGIAGSTRIGHHCQIGGACNIVGHIVIADHVVVNASSLVSRSIEQAGRYGSGMPLLPEQAWRRSFVTLGKLDQLIRRIRKLERQDSAD
ncbi:UDP-3-O-(3-hydroxymyristoyl)glucosamine N-acyltransferase [Granulosicoccus antarcticus]|uniref:UDP-3-O-acylglucosamine N-acyltransferase n=1 Tax=Granulosicoccus antarcticus IMCC3135 TaxID=1192854 RepID=A0A2Z2NZE4_9GAMM|nr:UDP-3-O-(3-hydroxymyristoyl)glucosamine N-acyltransferase [Granulosicoccus antarcticus]ASJ75158.1 UDP-3-O-(3-hydroxymyristoyl)glucosamine N-acyltransferase [Granulosicoccus antarcticus IMCC3135]